MNNIRKIKDRIVSKINNHRINLRLKRMLFAGMFGLKKTMIFIFISIVLFFNLFSFYIKSNNRLEYVNFGDEGAYTFFDEEPDDEINNIPHLFINKSGIHISER